MRRSLTLTAAAVALALLLGGCGSPGAEHDWRTTVAQAAEQAAAGDLAAADATLVGLERDVTAAGADGRLDPARADAILASAAAVRAELAALLTPPSPQPSPPSPSPSRSPSPSPSPSPTASSSPDPRETGSSDDDGKGRGDRGKGSDGGGDKGKDDDDDD